MKKDTSSNSEDVLLPREEWDFSEVANDELIHFKHWEYGREINSWKKKSSTNTTGDT